MIIFTNMLLLKSFTDVLGKCICQHKILTSAMPWYSFEFSYVLIIKLFEECGKNQYDIPQSPGEPRVC